GRYTSSIPSSSAPFITALSTYAWWRCPRHTTGPDGFASLTAHVRDMRPMDPAAAEAIATYFQLGA
ncbi:MAG: hypothetical protein RAK18_07455, partial [Conexivisphaerales archaeon]|nr:hypothetical protein [Conexivisphaerales archaeon]